MHVAGTQAEPIHGRQMPDRIALMTVQHELGRRRGAGGEIKKERIVGAGFAVGRELRRRVVAFFVRHPAGRRAADGDACVIAGQLGEFRRDVGGGDDVAHAAAREAVGKVVAREQHGRRHDHRAELHRRQHAFPERGDIAEHEQNTVAAAHAESAQRVGDAVRTFAQLRKGELGLARILVGEPQRRALVATCHAVEIIERPVEAVELRPLEIAVSGGIVLAMADEEITRREKRRRVA